MNYFEWHLKKAHREWTIRVYLAHKAKNLYCQRDEIIDAYDECLFSETYVLGYKYPY